jgi:hypothetical protein
MSFDAYQDHGSFYLVFGIFQQEDGLHNSRQCGRRPLKDHVDGRHFMVLSAALQECLDGELGVRRTFFVVIKGTNGRFRPSTMHCYLSQASPNYQSFSFRGRLLFHGGSFVSSHTIEQKGQENHP